MQTITLYWQLTIQNAHFNDPNDTYNDLSSAFNSRSIYYISNFGISLSLNCCVLKSKNWIEKCKGSNNKKKNSALIDIYTKDTKHKMQHQQCNNVISTQKIHILSSHRFGFYFILIPRLNTLNLRKKTMQSMSWFELSQGETQIGNSQWAMQFAQLVICYCYASIPCTFSIFLCCTLYKIATMYQMLL